MGDLLGYSLHLAKWQMDLADRVVPRESVVIKDMKVQNSGLQLVDGKSWVTNTIRPVFVIQEQKNTFEKESLVPSRVEGPSFYLRLQSSLFVRQ
jgi:hypothetical protein